MGRNGSIFRGDSWMGRRNMICYPVKNKGIGVKKRRLRTGMETCNIFKLPQGYPVARTK